MHVAAIIAAGGRGSRLGGEIPKQFIDLGDGTVMVQRVLQTFASCPLIAETVVAIPEGGLMGFDEGQSAPPATTFVSGGARRQDSVRNALERVSARADVIVIHDAARPFVTVDLIERTIRAADQYGAAIAAIPVVDTVKQIARGARRDERLIQTTLPRETIFLAQTPQAFRRDVLEHAMSGGADTMATDESMLVERSGMPVHIVEGDPGNIKVTTAADFALAHARVTGTNETARGPHLRIDTMRIGTGYDLHRLVDGRPLILAGVRIPFERGLQGHSDADIVCHAVTDAILGAAAAGDIGQLFPDTDPRWKDADSLELLSRALAVVFDTGLRVANVDITVIAERPKLLPYLDQMRLNLARTLLIETSWVSVKGKTNEGVGEIGRAEAMACHAVALLVKA